MTKAKHLPKILTAEEQIALLEQLPPTGFVSYRNRCIVLLMLDCGLRVSEAASLRPEHLNLQTGKLIVREGKGLRDREVYLSDSLRDLIAGWIEAHSLTYWLFPTQRGTRIQTSYLRRVVKECARLAGIQEWEKVHPHSMRHTMATDFLNQPGANIRMLQEILGHSSVSTTMLYTHVSNAAIRTAMQNFRNR